MSISLAVVGPCLEVLWHHPESGPRPFEVGHFQARLEPAVGPVFLRVHPDGVHITVNLAGLDLERSVGDRRQFGPVLGTGDIGLDLVVAPAASAGLIPPFVLGRHVTFVELILPDKLVPVGNDDPAFGIHSLAHGVLLAESTGLENDRGSSRLAALVFLEGKPDLSGARKAAAGAHRHPVRSSVQSHSPVHVASDRERGDLGVVVKVERLGGNLE